MDKLAELSHGAKVVLGSAILLLIFSFLNWFEVEDTNYGVSMWEGIGVVGGLFLIALIAWQAVRLANINLNVGVGPAMVTAFLAILAFIFIFIRWIDKPGGGLVEDAIDRTIWAWLGLILAIIIVGGAWANMKMTGESFGDLQKLGGGSGGGGSTPPPPSTPSQPPPSSPPGDDNP